MKTSLAHLTREVRAYHLAGIDDLSVVPAGRGRVAVTPMGGPYEPHNRVPRYM